MTRVLCRNDESFWRSERRCDSRSLVRRHWHGFQYRFNANLVAGIEEVEAAKQTWTGERALDYQLVNARVRSLDPYAGPHGQYIEVVVDFTR